jgi:spoIIIJ-associated protein
MSPEMIFEGKTTEEAINSAAKALDIRPENLDFTILSTGSKGLFGLGGKKAKIQVLATEPRDPNEMVNSVQPEKPVESVSPETPAQIVQKQVEPEKIFLTPIKSVKTVTPERALKVAPAKVGARQKPVTQSVPQPVPQPNSSLKTSNPVDPLKPAPEEVKAKKTEKRVRRPKPGEKPEKSVKPDRPENSDRPDRPSKPARSGRPERREAAKSNKVEPESARSTEESPRVKWSTFPIPGPLTKPGKGETIYDGPPDQAMLDAVDLLKELIQRLGLVAEIRVSRIGQRIILELDSLDNYLLIGRKGTSLNALELMINRITRQRNRKADKQEPGQEPDLDKDSETKLKETLVAGEVGFLDAIGQDKSDDAFDENPQIIVDAENYRARRHQGILEKAAFMADKVLKNNKPQVMTQLSSPERRLVHLAIESIPGLTTRSHGIGLVRNLTILPKKVKI